MRGCPITSEPGLALTDVEQAMLDGAHGEAVSFAMQFVVDLARILRASSLVEVSSVHVDGCLYHGQAGLDFVRRLADLGGRVAVPTTLNVGSLDLLHPDLVSADAVQRRQFRALMDAYADLGAEQTWTCAPYQLPRRPRFGEHVAWAESNAIVFANSVLGARTDRYGDFLDICAAVTGRAPNAGLHLDHHRKARAVFDCSRLTESFLAHDTTWACLGLLVGELSNDRVPALTGVTGDVSEDKFKAFGAAAASSGGVALAHIVGYTPEAPTLDAVLDDDTAAIYPVDVADLRAVRDALTSASEDRIDAVSVGTPHLSLQEFAQLAELFESHGPVDNGVEFWISTGRHVLAEAERLGYARVCSDAGAHLLVDTCTYVTSVLKPSTRVVMTNSAKWAWYGPANLGVGVVFGSLEDCVRSAASGVVYRDQELWG